MLRAFVRRRLLVAAISICRRRFANSSGVCFARSRTSMPSEQAVKPLSGLARSTVGQSPGDAQRAKISASIQDCSPFLAVPQGGRKNGVLPGESRTKARLDRSRMIFHSVGHKQPFDSSSPLSGKHRGQSASVGLSQSNECLSSKRRGNWRFPFCPRVDGLEICNFHVN